MLSRRNRPPLLAGLCALSLAVLLGARPAAADDQAGLARARVELADLRYEDARATLNGALEGGGNRPATTAQIYLLLGEVHASLGQRDEAAKAFGAALSIDPSLELRKGLSPKISGPFRKARRAQRTSGRIDIDYRVTGRPALVAMVVRADPFDLVAGSRVVFWGEAGAARELEARGEGAAGADRAGEKAFEVALPRTASRFTLAAIDQHGNRLAERGTEEQPIAVTVEHQAEPEPTALPTEPAPTAQVTASADERTPFYAHWLLWGGLAVATGAVGTWAGFSAQSAVNELDDIRDSQFEVEYSRAQSIADRAEQRSLIANVSFAAAGACAVVSAILYVRGRRASAESRAALVPLIGDQVGVAASLRF